MSSATVAAEEIHPSLWRASQLAHGRGRVVETGYPALSAELPGGGWPVGALVDLFVQHAGVGELRLLRPALSQIGSRPVAFVQPPHTPDGLGLSYIGLSLDQMLYVKRRRQRTRSGRLNRFCEREAAGPSFSGLSTRSLHRFDACTLRRSHRKLSL
jgi:protein ImuA